MRKGLPATMDAGGRLWEIDACWPIKAPGPSPTQPDLGVYLNGGS